MASKKWLKKAELYRRMAKDWDSCCDFSDDAAEDMYSYESTGSPKINYSVKRDNGLFNGFAVGKHWLDVNIAMWVEDLGNGCLTKFEFLEYGLPEDMTNKILDTRYR